MKQEQFLNVVTAEEAHRIFREAVAPSPLGEEAVPLEQALGRVLSQDIVSRVDVPAFDRSNMDGYAVRAEDTFGAVDPQPGACCEARSRRRKHMAHGYSWGGPGHRAHDPNARHDREST